jgi:serine/threonine-protein kinase RsbW
MSSGERSCTVPAEIGNLGKVQDFVADGATRAQLPKRRLDDLMVAVEEAFVNICHYAYSGSRGAVRVGISWDGESLEVELRDDGVAFDPLSVAEPDVTADLDQRVPGGLGIPLMRRMMDGLHYARVGEQNVLSLRMHLPART